MGRLDGKTALITGGAQGIGLAGATLFASEGAKVFIADINEAKGREAAAGIGATFIRCDVSKADEARAAVDACGSPDILYNNAGIYWAGHDARLTDVSEDDWDRVISVNLRSVFLFSKYALLGGMMARGGSIVNTATATGVPPTGPAHPPPIRPSLLLPSPATPRPGTFSETSALRP